MVANFMEVNSGPFDYTTGSMMEEKLEWSREILERRLERRKKRGGLQEKIWERIGSLKSTQHHNADEKRIAFTLLFEDIST